MTGGYPEHIHTSLGPFDVTDTRAALHDEVNLALDLADTLTQEPTMTETGPRPVRFTTADDGTPGVLMPVREGDTLESLDTAARGLIYDVHPVVDQVAAYEGRHRAEVVDGEALELSPMFSELPPRPAAADLLHEAAVTVEQRGALYDADTGEAVPERSLSAIAGYWNHYLSFGDPEDQLVGADVATMMMLLKIARLERDPMHRDSWTDLAGYAALGAEAAGL